MTKEKLLSDQHGHVWSNLVFAEQKAGSVFVLASGLLVYLHSQKITTAWLHGVCSWRFSDVTACIATLCLLACCVLLLLAVVPRLSGNSEGIIYWKAISECPTARAYQDKIDKETEEGLERELAWHIYELARICAAKFFWIRTSLWIGSFGTIAALFNLAFVKH